MLTTDDLDEAKKMGALVALGFVIGRVIRNAMQSGEPRIVVLRQPCPDGQPPASSNGGPPNEGSGGPDPTAASTASTTTEPTEEPT